MEEKLVRFESTSDSIEDFDDLTIEEYIAFIRGVERKYISELKRFKTNIERMVVHHEYSYDYSDLHLQAYRKHTEKELAAIEKKRKANTLRKLKQTEKQKETRLKQYKKLKKEFG